ncbi:MAG: heme-binding domain-containing protein [Flavobacteriales bacterium]|nr:heme-binding domain-containing protein [Flavobacteriales bacterium]
MDRKTIIIIVFAGSFLLMQLIPRKHSNPEVNPVEEFSPDRSVTELALLQSACFDCHSNETVYPWYSYVQPIALWLDHHVQEGREELNFSTWHTLPMDKQAHKLEECSEMVESKEMPLSSFTWTHPEARLSAAERQQIVDWFNRLRSEY